MGYQSFFIGSCIALLFATPSFAASDAYFSEPAKQKIHLPQRHSTDEEEKKMPSMAGHDKPIIIDAFHNKAVDFRNGMQSLFTQLRQNIRSSNRADRTIAITDFVNTEDIGNVNKFGRYLGEEAYNILPALDFNVLEVKAATHLFIIERKGEVILTRKGKELQGEYAFASLLVGTYTLTDNYIQVNARIVRIRLCKYLCNPLK